MTYPRIVIAGAHSGAGKTTLTLGLIEALKKMGLAVQPFKTGPDYIDSSYHSLVAGKSCRNLDTYLLTRQAVLELFERQARHADISVIEGVMGLYDGCQDREAGSTAHLAKMLKAPVILVVDARSMSRSTGALVLGYQKFDPKVCLKGIILNRVGSPQHYCTAKAAIERKTGIPVLGFLPRDPALILPERHLGLVPAGEKTPLRSFRKRLAGQVQNHIDVKRIVEISRSVEAFPKVKGRLFAPKPSGDKGAIAIARDAAFHFYYQDNLDLLEHYGARLIPFSPLRDSRLPRAADGLYLGGGFPELFAPALAKNKSLKKDIYERAKQGLPVYAECGGLMYLVGELIDFKNKAFPMTGIFNASVKMGNRLKALGYANVEVLKDNLLSSCGDRVKAHVFHWSSLHGISRKEDFVYRLSKRNGETFLDGLAKWNVLAGYSHFHFGSDIRLAQNFIERCRRYKLKTKEGVQECNRYPLSLAKQRERVGVRV